VESGAAHVEGTDLARIVTFTDGRLMSLNLTYLAFVVLVPFTTEVLGDHSDTTEAVVLYAAVLGLAALLKWLMIRHIVHGGHVRDEALTATMPFAERGWLFVPGIFFASIPVAFVSPLAASLMWIALLLVRPQLPRRPPPPGEPRPPSRS
jgi:TMEM175 potassium channel family protein